MAAEVKGVVARGKGAPVTVEEIVVPDPGPGAVTVDVQACGVCHTDLHYREGGINDEFPFLLSHDAAGGAATMDASPSLLGPQAAGVVDAVGPGVTEVSPADFVVLNWRAMCGA